MNFKLVPVKSKAMCRKVHRANSMMIHLLRCGVGGDSHALFKGPDTPTRLSVIVQSGELVTRVCSVCAVHSAVVNAVGDLFSRCGGK